MTSFDDSTTTFYEDSGIGNDSDVTSTTSIATPRRDRDDIEQEKRHLRKQIQAEQDFYNEMVYCEDGGSESDEESELTSKATEVTIKRLKSEIAEFQATSDAIFYEREEYRRESDAVEAQLPEVIKSKNLYHTFAMTCEEIAWAKYEGQVADEDKADQCEKETKKLSKQLRVENVKHKMLKYDVEELEEKKEMLEGYAKKWRKELEDEHDETNSELSYRTSLLKEFHYAGYLTKKEAYDKLKKRVEESREELIKLRTKRKESEEKLEATVTDRTDDLTLQKKEIAWLAETVAEKRLENEKLEALIAAESQSAAMTSFTQCQKLKAELSELKAQEARYNKRINDATWKADEAESRANLITKNRYPTLKVGDAADQTAKRLLQRMSFGSLNNVSTSGRLSFDPVNHGPRDDASFRPDQSTHYDSHSGSFCNSPKSVRQRPSSVSSQFKAVLRSCNEFPRSNSASRVSNRSLIS